MASLAWRNEVARAVPRHLPAYDMMNLQDLVPALALTMLTGMTVPIEDVFSLVAEILKRAILISYALYIGVFQFLRIERSHLDDNALDRKHRPYEPDDVLVRADLLLDRRCDKTFTLPVVKTWLTVAGIPVTTPPAHFPAGGHVFLHVRPKLDLYP